MSIVERRWLPGNDIPNAYLAFSTRKVKYGQKNVFELRENQFNAEKIFSGNKNYKLDTAEINTFLDGYNGFGGEWYDQIGRETNYKLRNTNASTQPQYIESGINSLPSLLFDNIPLTPLKNTVSLNYTTPATISSVIDVQGSQGGANLSFYGSDPIFYNNVFKTTLTGTSLYLEGRSNSGAIFSTVSISVNSQGKHIWTIVCDGVDKIYLYKDGALVSGYPYTVPGGFLNTFRELFINGFVGQCSELLIHDAALEEDYRKTLIGEQGDYFNIATT